MSQSPVGTGDRAPPGPARELPGGAARIWKPCGNLAFFSVFSLFPVSLDAHPRVARFVRAESRMVNAALAVPNRPRLVRKRRWNLLFLVVAEAG